MLLWRMFAVACFFVTFDAVAMSQSPTPEQGVKAEKEVADTKAKETKISSKKEVVAESTTDDAVPKRVAKKAAADSVDSEKSDSKTKSKEPAGSSMDEKPGTQLFTGKFEEVGGVQVASGFSPDGLAATVLFRNLAVASEGRSGDLVETKSYSFTMPLKSKEMASALMQRIRGFVEVEEGARAVLVVQAAGKTTVVDLTTAEPMVNSEEDMVRTSDEVTSPMQAQQQAGALAKVVGLKSATKPKGAIDFQSQIEGELAVGASYVVTLTLLAERDSTSSSAMLVVDSFDVELSAPSVAKR